MFEVSLGKIFRARAQNFARARTPKMDWKNSFFELFDVFSARVRADGSARQKICILIVLIHVIIGYKYENQTPISHKDMRAQSWSPKNALFFRPNFNHSFFC